jgi:hypothetical protein
LAVRNKVANAGATSGITRSMTIREVSKKTISKKRLTGFGRFRIALAVGQADLVAALLVDVGTLGAAFEGDDPEAGISALQSEKK